MASVELTNLTKALEKVGSEVHRRAMLNLGALQDRKSVRIKWDADTKRPKSWVFKKRKRRLDASKQTRQSMRIEVVPAKGSSSKTNIGISMQVHGAEHVEYLDKGRYPYMTRPDEKGKGIPPSVLRKWVRLDKKIKPRDLQTGKLLPRTDANYKSMEFLMNRKIRWFGIEPTHFLTNAIEVTKNDMGNDILMAYAQDIKTYLER